MNIAGGGQLPFRLVTTTLLSLLLPLSFLLLSRLSSASFLFSLIKSQPHTESSFFYSLFLRANPAIVYVVVSSVSVYTLVLGLTTRITAADPKRSIALYPHVSIAWLTLFLVQISVALGLETTISNGLIIGSERNFLSRLVFFFGLHEVMLLWSRLIVRPVVDNTLLGKEDGQRREETMVERVALAVSCGTLWWWKLRDEVEALVGVAEAKRALLLLLPIDGNLNVSFDVGTLDFLNWWLYYMVVTIGMVRIVKGSLWFGMILLFEQGRRRNPRASPTASNHEGDNKV
ncbi:hypothetical protein CARUB_v10023780mg [Capsella rubella]|uniref:Transmembrane protein n=1 Tax=Capsella rubella TaxID=81985 RepID=R0FXA9_9BRAS|nr:uncharacterized protein LOC17890366 [Capsella rubella]EOA27632.1 hypothetical protein CARUB_v10023780mg [Capsella rubella]